MLGGHILQGRTMALEVDVLSAEGRYGDALALNDRHHRFQDSLNSIQQNQVLFDIEARYQKEEREREIALLSAQNEIKDLTIQRSERQRLMLLLGLLAFALITGTALYTYRAKQRLNQQLVEKNTLVTNSLAEKELLLKEIHHRVKNNLEIISGLLYLQSKYVEDENVLEAIREGQNRVRSMSLIHKNLYQEENLTGISIQAYLDKLVDGLMKSYKVGTNHIDIRKDIARLNLDVDTAIPLALIINELISNALKYAFPGDRPGTMCISLHELDNELVLNVEDDGVGLPEDFNIGESHSLGFRLVDMFTQKLEGVLQISGDHGTRVTLRIAKYKVV
jgi:two-component sensor histidine kinase